LAIPIIRYFFLERVRSDMKHWVYRSGGIALAIACTAFAFGCGSSGGGSKGEKIIVKGKVTVDGNPGSGVALAFYAPKENATVGNVTTQEDGSYEVMFNSQPGEGNYKVTATRWQMKKGAAATMGEGLDEQQLRMSGAAVNMLPDRYSSIDKSGLTAVLQPGKNEKDFALKGK